MPVIIWCESAVASIIEQEGIGIAISSIAELEQRLQTLTTEDLERKRNNVTRVSQRLASDLYFQEALRSALSIM